MSAPQEVTIEVERDIDLERGDVLATGVTVPTSDYVEARLVWLHGEPGHRGRRVEFRLSHANTRGSITRAWAINSEDE